MTVLPGPSAVETALVASGLVGERYAFVGFLPRREAERAALWTELDGVGVAASWRSSRRSGSPGRLASLAAAAPEREVAVCRELTKRFEEVVRGPASELAQRFAEGAKGEITVVIGPGEGAVSRVGGEAALAAVAALVAAGTPRRVAAEVVSSPDGRVPKRPLPRIFVTTL